MQQQDALKCCTSPIVHIIAQIYTEINVHYARISVQIFVYNYTDKSVDNALISVYNIVTG